MRRMTLEKSSQNLNAAEVGAFVQMGGMPGGDAGADYLESSGWTRPSSATSSMELRRFFLRVEASHGPFVEE